MTQSGQRMDAERDQRVDAQAAVRRGLGILRRPSADSTSAKMTLTFSQYLAPIR